mgnify:CR=1 FL=1
MMGMGIAEQLASMQQLMMDRFDRIDSTLAQHSAAIQYLDDELKNIRMKMDTTATTK